MRCEDPVNPTGVRKTPLKQGPVPQRTPEGLGRIFRRGPDSGRPGNQTQNARAQTPLSRGAGPGAGPTPAPSDPRAPPLSARGPPRRAKPLPFLREGDSQLLPLFALLSPGSFLAPRALLAAPPAALSNCLLEVAVKCREGRYRFTAASPRLEPGSAHRRQPCL